MVAAAVILWCPIRGVRIDDSKRLTALQRERACERILRNGHTGVGIACAEDIDRHNILQASLLAMQRAVQDLPVAPDVILVDGSAKPPLHLPCWTIPHGDSRSRLIACASIVAKVLRDRLMRYYHRLLPAYRFDLHKGYGTAIHQAALSALGPCVLHRMSFAPIASLNHGPVATLSVAASTNAHPKAPLPVLSGAA